MNSNQSNGKFAIVIHGGAGPLPSVVTAEAIESRRNALSRCLDVGKSILEGGGSAVDAVEQVVRMLEDDPQFNAGVGSVFNSAGSHELDASIMDGADLSCGAVAGVSHIKNPIRLARLVMTKTRHVLLAGDGAEQFGKKMAVDWVEPESFDTDATREAFERIKSKIGESGAWNKETKLDLQDIDTGSYHGTVGCVALDRSGNLAAATSTGGMTNKQFGRIGDSPIIGAGTYADNRYAAVSCTGHGEQFIRHAVAYDVVARIKYTQCTLDAAVSDILRKQLQPAAGGMIAIDAAGNIVMDFTTPEMARAAADSSGRYEIHWAENPRRLESESR